MLLRAILLVGLAAAAWLLLRRFWPSQEAERPSEGEYRRMVACRHCGVHLPADEAITRDGASYCCRAHLPE